MIQGKRMLLLVASRKDLAGQNIAQTLLSNYPLKQTKNFDNKNLLYSGFIRQKRIFLTIINEEITNSQNLTKQYQNLEFIIFLSRHSSISGKPTFSVHTPGNFSTADFGGLPKKLSIAPAEAMKNALKALQLLRDASAKNFDVSYECTHHGPSLNIPSMFVELGSSKTQWCDVKAAEIVGHAAVSAISKFKKINNKTAVLGIGGPHYNQKFTKLALTSDTIFGHIIPKYQIEHLTIDIVNECLQKTLEKINYALLDWKGIKGSDKPNLLKILKDINLPYKKI